MATTKTNEPIDENEAMEVVRRDANIGQSLECAVKEIETVLIKENPAFAQASWTVEKNRVFVVGGVPNHVGTYRNSTRASD